MFGGEYKSKPKVSLRGASKKVQLQFVQTYIKLSVVIEPCTHKESSCYNIDKKD